MPDSREILFQTGWSAKEAKEGMRREREMTERVWYKSLGALCIYGHTPAYGLIN
jgi:hypothetical protein